MISALTLVLFLGAPALPADSTIDLAPPRSLFERTFDRTADPVAEIRRHLTAVLAELRERPAESLSPELAAARDRNLATLGEYIEAGVFPRNRTIPGLRPIFIDGDGSACAVGYLMLENGGAEVARAISARENYDYLPDITTPGAAEWIARSGLTAEECAKIQPSYPCFVFTDLACASAGSDVVLTWDTAWAMPWITIYRGMDLVAELTNGETVFVDVGVPPGTYEYSVVAFDMMCTDFRNCTVVHGAPNFRRGDANGDGTVDAIGDAVFLLQYGFAGGAAPACLEAADADDDGEIIAIVDAIRLLDYGFNGGSTLAAPFPDCGADPSAGTNLGCAQTPASCP